MQNSFLLALLPGKPHGFGSCSLIHFDSSLEPVVISMTTRAVSNIRDSCVSQPFFETHGDEYHFYVIWSDGELLVFGIYRLTKQTTDVFTKPLSETKLGYFRDMLGVVENAPLAKREC